MKEEVGYTDASGKKSYICKGVGSLRKLTVALREGVRFVINFELGHWKIPGNLRSGPPPEQLFIFWNMTEAIVYHGSRQNGYGYANETSTIIQKLPYSSTPMKHQTIIQELPYSFTCIPSNIRTTNLRTLLEVSHMSIRPPSISFILKKNRVINGEDAF